MKYSVVNGAKWFWREWGKPLLMVAVIIAPFRASIADWYDVPTGSMRPTILDGDRVFVNKLAYDLKMPFTSWQVAKWRDPARGDVVVLKSPADEIRLVKRVIGLPGDVIEMDRNHLKVNGQIISYEPLDSKTVPQVAADERSHNRFFTEQLPGKPHSIMTIPSVPAYRSFRPIKVPDGQYFVMGDNRDNSADSRFFGFVERNRILGQATAVVFSLDHDRYFLPRWRFLKEL